MHSKLRWIPQRRGTFSSLRPNQTDSAVVKHAARPHNLASWRDWHILSGRKSIDPWCASAMAPVAVARGLARDYSPPWTIAAMPAPVPYATTATKTPKPNISRPLTHQRLAVTSERNAPTANCATSANTEDSRN